VQVQPYLFFNGRCDEAIGFYRKALGAEVTMLTRFKDNPNPAMNPPGFENKVMHASLKVGSTTIFTSDGASREHPTFGGFSLSIEVANDAEADRLFAPLAEGGQVLMPLDKTFFSSRFGMLTDRFGVGWMIIVAQ
jgi:PhnB protein